MSDGKFVDTPMTGFDAPTSHKGTGPGQYNGETTGPFGEFTRTPSPNAVPELTYDKGLGEKPSGEKDQF